MRRWRPPVWWAAIAAAGYPRAVLTPEHDRVATVVVIEGARAWRELACFAPPDVWADIASRVLDDTAAFRAEYDTHAARATLRVVPRRAPHQSQRTAGPPGGATEKETGR